MQLQPHSLYTRRAFIQALAEYGDERLLVCFYFHCLSKDILLESGISKSNGQGFSLSCSISGFSVRHWSGCICYWFPVLLVLLLKHCPQGFLCLSCLAGQDRSTQAVPHCTHELSNHQNRVGECSSKKLCLCTTGCINEMLFWKDLG